MSDSSDTVDCPQCGTAFDPDQMGGWCTNPDCGEYRYDPPESGEQDGGGDLKSGTGSGDGTAGASTPDSPRGEDHEHDPVEGASMADPTDSDAQAQNEPTESEGTAEPPSVGDDETVCPDCGSTVPDEAFCLDCGADLSDTADTGPDQDQAPEVTEQEAAAEPAPDQEEQTAPEETEGAAAGAADSPKSEPEQTPETVVLSVGESRLRATDGESLGGSVRTAFVDAGGDSADAQLISREHVRFERDGAQFYIIDVSTNGTKVNGTVLDKHDRHPIEDGDTISFAGVTDGTVMIEYQ